jgi:hypothetical protein
VVAGEIHLLVPRGADRFFTFSVVSLVPQAEIQARRSGRLLSARPSFSTLSCGHDVPVMFPVISSVRCYFAIPGLEDVVCLMCRRRFVVYRVVAEALVNRLPGRSYAASVLVGSCILSSPVSPAVITVV